MPRARGLLAQAELAVAFAAAKPRRDYVDAAFWVDRGTWRHERHKGDIAIQNAAQGRYAVSDVGRVRGVEHVRGNRHVQVAGSRDPRP